MEDKIFPANLSEVCSKREAAMVKQIFLDLCEVKRYWDVEYLFESTHRKTFITAKLSKTQKPSLFVPSHLSDSTNFLEMRRLLSLNNDQKFHSIFLAFINADTTCVYYQINEGLLQPKAITSKHLVRNSQNIRDSLIRKNKDLIEQSASYGIPITLKLDPGDDESTDHRKDV
ncbi:uncharacterized protein LOC123672956 [Harmonia axyridis]|uniref:uncharacterized protein LOC123672956 n=1 Tax=Harmonia axyridis TaxID=115357 RepID=UPI001E2788E0|nr:uncharacterized protein LOC123672956 [Harmonia axyridis]